ncbi:MAG: SAP domain-containing protein [Colwellia sp.]|nr:SAP domain-containing protein [Colwellia sp.]
MNYPITYGTFCQKLISKYESNLNDYKSAQAWRSMFRISLEETRELCLFLEIGSMVEARYKAAVGDSRLCVISNYSDPDEEYVEFTFIEPVTCLPEEDARLSITLAGCDRRSITIPKKYVFGFVKRILKDANEEAELNALVNAIPDLTEQQKQFNKNKRDYFANQDNWDTIKVLFELMMLKIKKKAMRCSYKPAYISVFTKILMYFPFSSSLLIREPLDFEDKNPKTTKCRRDLLNELLTKFVEIDSTTGIIRFYGQLLALSTDAGDDICEDYLLGLLQPSIVKQNSEQLTIKYNDFTEYYERYYLDLDEYSFTLKQYILFDEIFRLEGMRRKMFNSKVFENINPNIPILDYVEILNSVYRTIGLPIDPSIDDALLVKGNGICGNDENNISYWCYWKQLCSNKNKFDVSKEFLIEKLQEWDLDTFTIPLNYLIQYYTEEGQYVKTLFDDLKIGCGNSPKIVDFLDSIHYSVIVATDKIVENYDYIRVIGNNSMIMWRADNNCLEDVNKLLALGVDPATGKYFCNLGQIDNYGHNIIDVLCNHSSYTNGTDISDTSKSIISLIFNTGECGYSQILFDKACEGKIFSTDDIITSEEIILQYISAGSALISDCNLMNIVLNKMTACITVLQNRDEIYSESGVINANILNRFEIVLKTFNGKELKNILQFHDLKYSGTKKVLVKRIMDYLSTQNQLPIETSYVVKKTTEPTVVDLQKLTCKALEGVLSNFNAKVSGIKAVKIARIEKIKEFSTNDSFNTESLGNLLKSELRDVAKNINLLLSGSKAELLERLLKLKK